MQRAQVIEMRVCVHDCAYLEPMFFYRRKDLAGISARVYDDALMRFFIAQNVAVDAKRTDDEGFEYHHIDYKSERWIVKASRREYNCDDLDWKPATRKFRNVSHMPDSIDSAILNTLRYAAVFDYALTRSELHRYLIGAAATREQIDRALDDPTRLNGSVSRIRGYITLPYRESSVAARSKWRVQAQPLWDQARCFTRLMAHLPFVRMIAVSGGLAMDNARDYDIDLLIVTAPRRLWLVRGFAVALVRLARLKGVKLCPNFLLTVNALTVPTQDLYNAHELAQMVPMYGLHIHAQMLAQNTWARAFLPNAFVADEPREERVVGRAGQVAKNICERLLRGRRGDQIESWEMNRKVKKLSTQVPANVDSVQFSPDVCRGFFSGHGRRILKEYYEGTDNFRLATPLEQLSGEQYSTING